MLWMCQHENMTILQHFIVQDKNHIIFVTISCREWLNGYSRCKFSTCGYIQGSNIMNIIKSTTNRVYDKAWLNKNIKAFYHKTWKLGDPNLLFARVWFESCLNFETKIDTPLFYKLFAESDMLWEHENIATFYRPQFEISSPFFTICGYFQLNHKQKCTK